MPSNYVVPSAVRRTAERALALQAESPLAGVVGMSVAEALAGEDDVDAEIVKRIRRYGRVNQRLCGVLVSEQLRTEADSSEIRSWLMYGGEAGLAWATTVLDLASSSWLVETDPTDDLLSLMPDEVYQRFACGAWRYEYGLTPAKAARFLEHYSLATGAVLEIGKAFGESAAAVDAALHARYHAPDPLAQAAAALMVEDDEYCAAANRDLAEMADSIGESLDWPALKVQTPSLIAKTVWAQFVAYVILAVERPDLIVSFNSASKRPPAPGIPKGTVGVVASAVSYSDPINTYIAYFHPDGAHYVASAGNKDFEGIEGRVFELVDDIWLGKKIPFARAKKLLGEMRRWTALNKMAGSLFHVFNADWAKGNWQHILDNIPTAADVRPAFEQFTAANPMPSEGVKLQQTLSDAATKDVVLNGLRQTPEFSLLVSLQPVKIDDTKVGAYLSKQGTPIGVYSLVTDPNGTFKDEIVLGAFETSSHGTIVVSVPAGSKVTPANIAWETDEQWFKDAQAGQVQVKLAHYEMPGTAYSVSAKLPDPQDKSTVVTDKVTAAPKIVGVDLAKPGTDATVLVAKPPAPVSDKSPAQVYMEDTFGDNAQYFKLIGIVETKLYQFLKVNNLLGIGALLYRNKKSGLKFTYLAARRVDQMVGDVHYDDTILLFEVGADLMHESDVDFVKALVAGKVEIVANGEVVYPVAAKPVVGPAWGAGKLIEYLGHNWMILDIYDGNYVMYLWSVVNGMQVAISEPCAKVDSVAVERGNLSIGWALLAHLAGGNPPTVTPPAPLMVGAKLVWMGHTVTLAGSMPDKTPIVGYWTKIDGYDALVMALAPELLLPPVVPDYIVPGPAPEPSLAEEAGPTGKELSGTQAAFDKAAKLGWKMTVKSSNPLFKWNLADILAYDGEKVRVIIGYAFNPSGVPIYVMTTETGAVNFKEAANGNKAYGPKQGVDQVVLKSLLPLPTAKPKLPAAVLPKLNYKLSDDAIAYAKAHNLVYVDAPKSSPFYVGSTVFPFENKTELYILYGWTVMDGEPSAVLWHSEGVVYEPAVVLAEAYGLSYKYGTKIDPEDGVVTVGKTPADYNPSIGVSPTVTIPCALPEGWDNPHGVEQPPFDALPSGSHISAGVIAIIPPGSPVHAKAQTFGFDGPVLLMTHPLNEYAGYKLTFPKGTIEPGEPMVKTAVREVWEETGLSVKPLAYLGDYKGKTSLTRFFIGRVTGGDPKKAGKETDAVSFRVLKNWPPKTGGESPIKDYVESLKWWPLLLQRDREVMMDLVAWMLTNGVPGVSAESVAEFDATPASTQAVSGVGYNPGAQFTSEAKAPNQLVSTIDYTVDAKWQNLIAQEMDAYTSSMIGWAYWSVLPFLNQGYPPVGVLVQIKYPSGTLTPPARVLAYTRTVVKVDQSLAASRVVLAFEDDNGVFALLVSPSADGVKVRKPEEFIPYDQKKAVVTAVADETPDDFWEALFKKLPIPLTTAAVSALKRAAQRKGAGNFKFATAMKAIKGGPPYSHGFVTKGFTCLAMGVVELVDGSGKSWTFQLGVEDDGTYHAFDATAAGLSGMQDSPGVTASYKIPDPWFTHPDPAINSCIKKLAVNGGNLEAVVSTMKIFKEKWLKEAGVPYYAVASQVLVESIAALFVPGACTKPEMEAVLGCLKKRMQLTQKGKKTTSNDTVLSSAPTPVSVVATPTVVTQGWSSPSIAALLENPVDEKWSVPGAGFSGGSKPNYIITNAKGQKFVWKPTPDGESPFRPFTDKAAYDLLKLVKPHGTVPVGIVQIGGKIGSAQPVVDAAVPLSPSDYAGFTDADKAEILASHAGDMFIGDHDGHFGNWLRAKGKLVPIDKGQAFKFILKGTVESLDPSWTAPGNFGVHVAKKLLLDWAKGLVEIPASAFAAMWGVIQAVHKLSPAQIDAVIGDLAVGANYTGKTVAKLTEALKARASTYDLDWTAVMQKLGQQRGEVFDWPAGSAVSTPSIPTKPAIPKVVPPGLSGAVKALGFTQREIAHIETARKSGYQGKSIQVDRDAFENQEVMVKRVKYSSADSPEQYATLIHFRIGRSAGLRAESKLKLKAKVVAGSVGGPSPLIIDEFWAVILAGVKTVNYHMSPGGKSADGIPKAETIAKVKALVPKLMSIKAATQNPSGSYEGVSNTAANQMASNYLQYVETVLQAAAQSPKMLDAPVEQFFQFLWKEPENKAKEEEDEKADIKVIKTMKAGFWPTSQASGTDVVVKGSDSPFYEPGGSAGTYKHSQYQITIPSIPGARVYWNPVTSESGYNEVRTHFGQGWGLIPGEPTEAKVAVLLKAFQDATGLSTEIPSDDDEEVLYLSKQAYLLQGKITPDSDGTGVKDPAYAAALALYAKGDVTEARDALRSLVAKKLGTTPAALVKLPGYNAPPTYTRDAGFGRALRLGWDREKLQKFLGADVYLAHHITQGSMLSFLELVVPKNGALLSNAVRPYYGVPLSGASVSADFPCGGSASIFTCMRKASSPSAMQTDHLYFDISVFLRTDVYVVGSGDAFGSDKAERFLTPEQWKENGLHNKTGSVSTGSGWQFNVRHDLDLRQYLAYAVFGSKENRAKAIALCKQHGWATVANGRKIEDAFIVS